MLKDYLKKQNISIYSLSKESGIPYSTLNDLVNGKVDIDNCRVSMLTNLSKVLNLNLDNIYKLCVFDDNEVYDEEYKITGKVLTKNKDYYVGFLYDEKYTELRICTTRTENRDYIKIMALWTMQDFIRKKEMEKLYVLLLNEKRQ